ncbi:Ultraviolet-B receptor uvr8 [Haplosporangium sp. Z 767]|nr:Ultraviolet-B receptor uvr8 [Haplosporangium sp. Z 767]
MTGSNKDNESLLQEPAQIFMSHELPHLSRPLQWQSVTCGWAFTIAVAGPETESGSESEPGSSHDAEPTDFQVYAWGSGSFGELGLGAGITKTGRQAIQINKGLLDTTSWTFPDQFQILKVRAGLRHVLLLAKEKVNKGHTKESQRIMLMGWGNNRQGQLGILERSGAESSPLTEKELRAKFFEPTRIHIPTMKKDSNASTSASDSTDQALVPETLPEIVDMACGQNHSLILFSDGTVYASGCNKYGQLGLTASSNDQPKFRIGFEQVVGLPFMDSISCGWNHNAAMDMRSNSSSTTIYLWGRNDHGQLGNSDASSFRTVAVDISGVNNIHLGIVQLRIPKASGSRAAENNECEEIVSYSCGSEHTLAMTRSGHCYAWGWNEHGNCGSGGEAMEDLKDVPVPRRVQFPKTVSSASPPSSVSEHGWVTGGYGSSWVWT